ncbi:hypothetical protein PsYK624_001330 [Phanerochaete sordida]|uniref:N-acetyltransferase domain-containing protein n=1 Tax=Phanerochaete sordida TaxID=48140 RepID=A0A9P3L7J5_9APHY|nr:hypothetical protein PsYK624_001330 [Phanerochaete sordida]
MSSSTATAQAKEQASPRPLGYSDVPTAVATYEAAFKEDPFHHWLRDTPDYNGSMLPVYGRRAESYMLWHYFVTRGLAWTVDDGAAIVCYGPAKSTLSLADKALISVFGGALGLKTRLTLTAQQRQRGEELRAKHKAAFKEALGDREEEVIGLQVLATHPEKQGHGYGSALVRTITGIADAQGRATALTSSNPANTGFYNSLGFVEAAQIVLGDEDPTWQEPPLILLVMIREPATH